MRRTSASGSSGSTSTPVSPDAPTTSGSAPPVVATTGTPQLIASMAGSENPSYRDGHDGHLGLAVEAGERLVARRR